MQKDDLERYDILEENLISLGTKYKYEFAKKHLKGRVIDIGSGLVNTGDYFKNPVALENDKECIELVKKRYPGLELVEGDAMKLPFPDYSFDGCMLSEVIEHMEDVTGLLAGIRRVLKPGGRVVITTPNRLITDIFVKLKVINPKGEGFHFKEYTMKELGKIIESNNFKVLKKTGIMQLRYSLATVPALRNDFIAKTFMYLGRIVPALSSDMIFLCERR